MQNTRRMRIRSSNRVKCMLCYVAAFAVPLLWHAAALLILYPYRLAMTAPDVAPALETLFGVVLPPADGYRAAVAQREALWLALVAAMGACAWLVTLLSQLAWRATRRCAIRPYRATQRAVRAYRLNMLWILLVNAGAAWVLWTYGVQFIAGRTLWDLLVYFGVFALLPPAAMAVSRLAAPPSLSGRHAFFKRI